MLAAALSAPSLAPAARVPGHAPCPRSAARGLDVEAGPRIADVDLPVEGERTVAVSPSEPPAAAGMPGMAVLERLASVTRDSRVVQGP